MLLCIFFVLVICNSSVISLVEFLNEYMCMKWTGVDIAIQMSRKILNPDHSDSAILQPLRVQMMGSVVV